MAARRAARGAFCATAASGAAFLAWRQAYCSLHGRHVQRVRADFDLGLSAAAGFRVMSDPRLLDETTPWWFHIVIRDEESQGVVRRLMSFVDAEVLCGGQAASGPSDGRFSLFHIRYWVYFCGVVPVPWTSAVGPVDEIGASRYRLTYQQASGPYGSFEHTHLVWSEVDDGCDGVRQDNREQPQSCHVEDTIAATVLGEPLLDTIAATVLGEPLLDGIAGVLLVWILRSRGETLTARFGGRVRGVDVV